MLESVYLFEFEVIVAPKLGVASSHRVGGFQQVVAKVTVSGLNHLGVFRFKITGLVLRPNETGKLCDRGLGIEPVDIANFSDNAGRVDLANARNGGQWIWDNFKLLFNGLVQNLDLLLQSPHGSNRYRHSLIHRII